MERTQIFSHPRANTSIQCWLHRSCWTISFLISACLPAWLTYPFLIRTITLLGKQKPRDSQLCFLHSVPFVHNYILPMVNHSFLCLLVCFFTSGLWNRVVPCYMCIFFSLCIEASRRMLASHYNKHRPEGSAELSYCQTASLQYCTVVPKGTFSSWFKVCCSSCPSLGYCSQSYFRHIHLCYKWSPKIRAYQHWLWAQGFFHCIKGALTFFHLIYFSSFWLIFSKLVRGTW